MAVESAGLLVFRRTPGGVEVLLTHPGGPIWGKRDMWSIPKGEVEAAEDRQAAAFREFTEEVGVEPPAGRLIDLGSAKQSSGKTNYIWAVEGSPDMSSFSSNTFTMEWPPRSGQMQEFPENDKAAWFDLQAAAPKVFKAQVPFLERLAAALGMEFGGSPTQQSLL